MMVIDGRPTSPLFHKYFFVETIVGIAIVIPFAYNVDTQRFLKVNFLLFPKVRVKLSRLFFLSSSVVERSAVNRLVVGSNPT